MVIHCPSDTFSVACVSAIPPGLFIGTDLPFKVPPVGPSRTFFKGSSAHGLPCSQSGQGQCDTWFLYGADLNPRLMHSMHGREPFDPRLPDAILQFREPYTLKFWHWPQTSVLLLRSRLLLLLTPGYVFAPLKTNSKKYILQDGAKFCILTLILNMSERPVLEHRLKRPAS